MEKSLKDQNKPSLLGVMAFNLLLGYSVFNNEAIKIADAKELLSNITDIFPLGLGIALAGIINHLLSSDMKSRIVFTKWVNPLPGCRAFSIYGPKDDRVNMDRLETSFGPLPTDPKKQNVFWYELYQSIQNDLRVAGIQKQFLFARDYTCFALLLLLIFGIGSFFLVSTSTALIYISILTIQLLITWIAARNLGIRFCTTVLAIKSNEVEK